MVELTYLRNNSGAGYFEAHHFADTVANWATRRNIGFTTYEDLASKPEVRELVSECVQTVNVELAQVETIKDFRLLPKELDHEDGELTATQKVKRTAVARLFDELITQMYGGPR